MYRILLLYEEPEKTCRLSDYLQLSGCGVVSEKLDAAVDCRELLQRADLVLFCCDKVEQYVETCEKIRQITQIPVIVLSGNTDEWMKIKMFRCGADDYLADSCSQGELMARIQSHIARYRRLTRPFGYIQTKDLEIEVAARRVFVRGEEVMMTVKEFDILLYLAQRPNEVVPKEKIYAEVWQDEIGEGYYNSVAVYIRRIREKIERDSESPQLVETVWGVGYRFRA